MKAGPATGVFHSVTSQANAVAARSAAKTMLARQVATDAAISKNGASDLRGQSRGA